MFKIILLLSLTSCSHYIDVGKKECDLKYKEMMANKNLYNNPNYVEKVVNHCSYYYDEAH